MKPRPAASVRRSPYFLPDVYRTFEQIANWRTILLPWVVPEVAEQCLPDRCPRLRDAR